MYSSEVARLTASSKKLVEQWNTKYSTEIHNYFKEQIDVLESVRNEFVLLKNKKKELTSKKTDDFWVNDIYEFHAKTLAQLRLLYSQLYTKTDIKDFIVNLQTAVFNDIQNLEVKAIDKYNTSLENTEKGIGSHRFIRKVGGFRYALRSVPRKFQNFFLRLFRKAQKSLKPRYHTIYYQCIVKGFLLKEYATCLQNTTFEAQKQLVQYAHTLFEMETKLINSNYQFGSEYDELVIPPNLSGLLTELNEFYSTYENKFITLLQKSGTLEFPSFYIRSKAKRNIKSIFKLAEMVYRSWNSTFFAFYEDWRFREQLFGFIAKVRIVASQTLLSYSSKLSKTLMPVIDSKREYIEQLIERIPNADNLDLATLKLFFTTELYGLQKEIRNQTIEADFEKTGTEIQKLLQKVEIDVTSTLEGLPNKAGVVRLPDYEKGIRKSDIYFFSPIEFIEFDCVPPLLNKINALSNDFANNLETIIFEFSDFDQITDFSIDTAVSMINAQSPAEHIVLMFREGMKRSLNILDNITELSNEVLYTKETDLTETFEHFVNSVKSLDDNDSIISIYTKLLKTKAIQESIEKRRTVARFLSKSSLRVTSFTKTQLNTGLTFYAEVRKRLKLDKAPVYVSSAISNYLADINKRIYKLPVIYRYLFENAPVKEINLFFSRQREIDTLNNALKDWKAGNYAASLVVGENGGGKSSLLQHYLKTVKEGVKIFYLSVNRFYHSENDFYELMQDVFDNKELLSDQMVLEQIANHKGQQVIVLDGLERVFLRNTGGFDCIHKLLSIIVSTNSQAFWICSVSLHASNYLNKTISLKENFDYLIELSNISSEEMRNIVLKRHRLSGYIVVYEDDAKQLVENKKNKERQSELEIEYFHNLNKFADSNISLSLYFWLESISQFTDKELYIKQFRAPDFSFLETLTAEKIYTLLLIVLHGRITIDLHAKILNLSKERSFWILNVLKEDSIVLFKGNYYTLNGILYRHVVSLLQNKNLIH